MTKSELPKNCYGYIDLRTKLKINHRDLLAIIRHHECPVAGQYNSTKKNVSFNFYYLPDIKKFIKTGKRAEVNTTHGEFKEWEVPAHNPAERLSCKLANQFNRLISGVSCHA